MSEFSYCKNKIVRIKILTFQMNNLKHFKGFEALEMSETDNMKIAKC